MLNEKAGKDFHIASRFGNRRDAGREAFRILIVDPVLGSRFSLAQAVSQPGVTVEMAASADEARSCLRCGEIALVIVDDQLSERASGLELLVELRESHPRTCRALVTDAGGVAPLRQAIERAGLSFVLSKPWDPVSLRGTIREILMGGGAFEQWSHRETSPTRASYSRRVLDPEAGAARRHEIVLCGLLAGLNSVEFESELYELLHVELSEGYRVHRSLWIDEARAVATRIRRDRPLDSELALEDLTESEERLLAEARRSLRVMRLDDAQEADALVCVCFAVRTTGRRALTALVWADPSRVDELMAILRDLRVGVQMAVRRIRETEARALAARGLARRVAEELRTPVGALAHAIDLLRHEAERAGLAPEWVERVCAESQRVVRAVEHLEGEMLTEQPVFPSTSN